ncbi:hypothetical protein EDD11_009485, partial [Mortierella claussenii]
MQSLSKISNCFKIHSQRGLSILGRGTIVNSLALATLWHVLWVFHPSSAWFTALQREVRNFVCPFKPQPSWLTICTPRSKGGLGVIDPAIQATAFQLKHIRNLLSEAPSIGHSFLRSMLQHYSGAAHPL